MPRRWIGGSRAGHWLPPATLLLLLLPLLLGPWLAEASLPSVGKLVGSPSGAAHAAVLLPFIANDVPTMERNLADWVSNGPPSCGLEGHSVSLMFYYSKVVTRELAKRLLQATKPLRPFFSDISFMSANLTEEEDGYPAGPSNMFYKMFLNKRLQRATRRIDYVFWMESDANPAKPCWLDALANASRPADFWMKGSLYKGGGFDSSASAFDAWRWLGHMNGNALYRLHSTEFNSIIESVYNWHDRNPYWQPFDTALWRYIHNFPYTWHLYQHIAHLIKYDVFIQHLGFTLTMDDIQEAKRTPGVYLIHGRRNSSGLKRYKDKFLQASKWDKQVADAEILGTVGPGRNLSVLIRPNGPQDVVPTAEAVESLLEHLQYALEVVVAVPETDVPKFRSVLPNETKVRVIGYASDVALELARPLVSLYADKYCRGDFILEFDAHYIFQRQIMVDDLFRGHLPLAFFKTAKRKAPTGVMKATAELMGEKQDFYFDLEGHMHVLPRSLYAPARAHAEGVLGRPLPQHLALAHHRYGNDSSSYRIVPQDFLKAYAYHNTRAAFHWVHSHHGKNIFSRAYADTVILPDTYITQEAATRMRQEEEVYEEEDREKRDAIKKRRQAAGGLGGGGGRR